MHKKNYKSTSTFHYDLSRLLHRRQKVGNLLKAQKFNIVIYLHRKLIISQRYDSYFDFQVRHLPECFQQDLSIYEISPSIDTFG